MKTIAIAGCGKLGNIVADAIGFGIADVFIGILRLVESNSPVR